MGARPRGKRATKKLRVCHVDETAQAQRVIRNNDQPLAPRSTLERKHSTHGRLVHGVAA
jgi:hypothetical protein